MIDDGLILIMIGAVTLLAAPPRNAIAYLRWHRLVAPAPHPDRLIVHAEVTVTRDPLLRGVAGIAEIYRLA